jgi:DNA helicase HerA-like ATPase
MTDVIGHIIGLSGSHMTLSMNPGEDIPICSIDDVIVTETTPLIVGLIKRIDNQGTQPIISVDLVGELADQNFSKGISSYPLLKTNVRHARPEEKDIIYGKDSEDKAKIGALYNDSQQGAFIDINKFLVGHFAVLGTSGVGKSSSVALLLNSLIEKMPQAHVIILDPHNEYTPAFSGKSHLLNADNITMPYWMLDFEEAVRVFVQGGTKEEQETQSAILYEAILHARKEYGNKEDDKSWITVDTPTPYRLTDVFQWLDKEMGRLNRVDTSAPYLRLKGRIETLQNDRRLSFMFPHSIRDTLGLILGNILRIPVDNKPATLIDLSGMPSEIVDVMVSVIFRVIFDFCVWSDRSETPPILLVCEEAHRYIPAETANSFAATTRAISRVAKEGRKYGLSLGLITQRPSELSQSVLSQCGTLCVLRMSNEADHSFVENILPEGSKSLLETVTALANREAIIVGEGVPMPMRILFSYLSPKKRPHSTSADFVKLWQTDSPDTFIRDTIHRWRQQIRKTHNTEQQSQT